jgi:O-antigen/teichoic acid export membrane protein
MRSKQAFRNVLSSFMLQVIIVITGIYIPQLMISTYGSDINGMVSSITQFITYLNLVEAGIGNATTVALYGPLAMNNTKEINGVMAASRKFYFKSGEIFAVLLVGLMIVFPWISEQGINPGLTRGMVIILGSSTLIDFWFLGKYRVLLNADQKGYIFSLVQSIATILNSITCIVLMYVDCSILIVKLAATLVYILRSVYIWYYIKKHYQYLNFKETPKNSALKQRWDVLIHQITGAIVNSTDVVIITIVIKKFVEVSVYTTYNLIISNIISLIESFSSSLCAGFGEIFAKGEKELVRESYSTYEYLYYIIMFTACVCLGILLIPFMKIYTMGIHDANYIRPVTAILFVLLTIGKGIRTPSMTMILAVGHYKQTKIPAVIEAVINIVVSLLLVRPLGINGLLIGTVCSHIYRTTDVILYNDRAIVTNTKKTSGKRILRNSLISIILIYVGNIANHKLMILSWAGWIMYAVLSGFVSLVVIVTVNAIAEKDEIKSVINLVKRILYKG